MKVLVTGSGQGLGLLAGERLAREGHTVVRHTRGGARTPDLVVGDVSTIDAMRSVAAQANALGRFDAVIHNVAVGYQEPHVRTADGLSQVFAVNVLAPYLLTALMTPPDRLVFMSSGLHRDGDGDIADAQWERRRWSGSGAYSQSKLFDVLLAFGVARHWPGVLSNAVDPGWVPTRMGGRGAPGDLAEGYETQAWLAVADDASASGEYFYHRRPQEPAAIARDAALQDELLDYCARLTGSPLPPLFS